MAVEPGTASVCCSSQELTQPSILCSSLACSGKGLWLLVGCSESKMLSWACLAPWHFPPQAMFFLPASGSCSLSHCRAPHAWIPSSSSFGEWEETFGVQNCAASCELCVWQPSASLGAEGKFLSGSLQQQQQQRDPWQFSPFLLKSFTRAAGLVLQAEDWP